MSCKHPRGAFFPSRKPILVLGGQRVAWDGPVEAAAGQEAASWSSWSLPGSGQAGGWAAAWPGGGPGASRDQYMRDGQEGKSVVLHTRNHTLERATGSTRASKAASSSCSQPENRYHIRVPSRRPNQPFAL